MICCLFVLFVCLFICLFVCLFVCIFIFIDIIHVFSLLISIYYMCLSKNLKK